MAMGSLVATSRIAARCWDAACPLRLRSLTNTSSAHSGRQLVGRGVRHAAWRLPPARRVGCAAAASSSAATGAAEPDLFPATVLKSTLEAVDQWLVTMDVGHVAGSYTVPGQYVHVCVPGQAATMLALASPPRVDSPVVEFLVKSSNQGSAKALCGAVPGTKVLVSEAQGAGFPMHTIPAARYPVLYIFATGTGLAPIRALAASGALAGHRSVHVYYGAKSPQHVPLSSALRAWSRDPRVEVRFVFSQRGQGYVQHRFALEVAETETAAPCKAAILCGQAAMTQELRAALAQRGVLRVLTNY